jgi:hypothetical protein
VALDSEMIHVVSIGEVSGYVITRSSCLSASAADDNVGNDAPVVLLHSPFRLGLTSGLRLGDDSCRLYG